MRDPFLAVGLLGRASSVSRCWHCRFHGTRRRPRGASAGLVGARRLGSSLVPPKGSPSSLRRAAIGVFAGGVGLAWVVRTLLDGECARLATQSCSETLMVAGSIILDAAVVGILLLVSVKDVD